jgi:hypothetical protein
MKTTNVFLRLFQASLVLSLVLIFTSCEKETEDDAPASTPTMGDPKSASPAGSQCYEITLFTDDGENETDDYSNIRFEFVNNGVVIARSPNQEWEGQWSFGFDDGVQKFFLNFNGTTPLLNELTDDWNVVSLTNGMPSFIEDDDPTPDLLRFSLSSCSPSGGGGNPALTDFNSNLVGDPWFIESFIDDGDNDTPDFNNISFTFAENGTVVAQRNNQSVTGLWASSLDDGQIELQIQFSGPALLTDLNEDWDVISFSTELLELEEVSPGDADFLTFSRTSGGGGTNPDLIAFNSNLVGQPWTISSFIDDGDNDTSDYNNVTFTFNANGSVVAQRNNQSRTGAWVSTIDNGQIELDIQFSGPALLNDLNEDWDVVSFSANQLELEDVSPGDADFLTFTRN